MASPDKKAFLLRLPPEVWAQLERLAAAELRSVNGQIEYLLREALARRMGSPGTPEHGGGRAASSNTPAANTGAPHPPSNTRRPQRRK